MSDMPLLEGLFSVVIRARQVIAAVQIPWRPPIAASEDRNDVKRRTIAAEPGGGARPSRRARIATPHGRPGRTRAWSGWRPPIAASEDRNPPGVTADQRDGVQVAPAHRGERGSQLRAPAACRG